MIDPNHPFIDELLESGFVKIACHAYLNGDRVTIDYSATRMEPRLTLHGRSRCGDTDEALDDLERQFANFCNMQDSPLQTNQHLSEN